METDERSGVGGNAGSFSTFSPKMQENRLTAKAAIQAVQLEQRGKWGNGPGLGRASISMLAALLGCKIARVEPLVLLAKMRKPGKCCEKTEAISHWV